ASDVYKRQIFRRPMACARQLREMAERHNLPVSVEWLGQSRRGHWQLLNRIAGGNFHQPAGSLPELWFVECDDPAAEADWLAREIVWLRRRYRYRWSDFVIVSRDFAGYESELRLALTVNGVPFAFDCPRPPARNRLLDLVEALFNLAIDRRWRFSSVFAVLKSWLLISSAAERDEIDQLENYCLAYDINSRRRWLELWDSSPEPEKEKVKVRWGQWLYSLVERLPRAGTVAGLVQALVGILTALQVFEKIGSGQAGDHADLDRQRETQFVAGAVQQVLSGLEERFGDEIMSLDDFAAIFCEAMAGTEIKTVPPSSDYVAISHFDRMKMPKRKVVFLSGLNEGVLPRRIGQGSILSVRDRRLLSKLDFELQAVGSESVRSDKFTLYALASQAGERLYLSCASYDQAGREMGPALIVRQLRGEGGDFSPPDRSEASYLTTRARAMRRLIEVEAGGGQPRWRHRFWRVVFKHLAGEEERATLKILAGPADLQSGKQVDSRLLLPSGPNQPVVVTASALESFNTCPFRYFCQRVLRLDRRRGWEPTAADYGQVLHEALRRWLQSGSADASRLIEMYDQVVARYRYGLLVHSGQAREICRRHRQNFRLVSRQLAAFIRASLFKPWQLESEFELHIDGPFREGGRLPVVLTGRIDRVDCWQCGDRVFRLLYDYKSRADRISYSQIAGGSELQLPLYLCALSGLADGHDKTVGLLYLPVRLKAEDLGEVPVDSPEVDRLLAKMRDPSMSMRGFVLDDEPGEIAAAIVGQDNFARFVRAPVGGKRPPPRGHLIVQEQFDLLLRFAVARAQAMVEQAYLRGVFAPDRQAFLSPSGNGNYACRFCDFPGVCQKGLARQQPARGRGDIDAGTFWHEVEEWSKREVKG
ncbi:MAG: PD-(D/E)XK nuclease family protein, partial [Negativicutes bacterium]|nr:PD-(D/E)XK nuclease family protein [Negativicutes bacterium]